MGLEWEKAVRLTVACTVMLAATFAQAQQWVPIADADGVTLAYDSSSVLKKNTVLQFWTVSNFKEPMMHPSSKKPFMSILTLDEVDCTAQKIRLATVIFKEKQDGLGALVDREIAMESTPMRRAPPGSVDFQIVRKVCNEKTAKP